MYKFADLLLNDNIQKCLFLIFTGKWRLLIVKIYNQYAKIKLLETIRIKEKNFAKYGKKMGCIFIWRVCKDISCILLRKKRAILFKIKWLIVPE